MNCLLDAKYNSNLFVFFKVPLKHSLLGLPIVIVMMFSFILFYTRRVTIMPPKHDSVIDIAIESDQATDLDSFLLPALSKP